MSIIYSYPVKVNNAQPDDLLVISDSADKNRTKQIKVSQLPSSSGSGISLTTQGTSGAATLIGNVLNIPDYSYALPLAADGTRGGLQIGFVTSEPAGAVTQFALNLSNEKGLVQVPAAGFNQLGLIKVGSCQGAFPAKLTELNTDELFQVETLEAGTNDAEYKFALTRLPVMTDQQKGIAKVYSPTYNGDVEEITTTANRTYGVQRDSNDKLVVNVPWIQGAGGVSSVTGTAPITAQTNAGVVTIQSGVYENAGGGGGATGTQGDLPAGGVAGQYFDGDGSWTNLPATPTVNNGTLTINVNGTPTTFTANQSGDSSVSITTGETGWSPLPIYAGETTLGTQNTGAFTQLRHATATSTLTINTVKVFLPQLLNNNPGTQNDQKFTIAIWEGSLTNWFNTTGGTVPTFLGQFKYSPDPAGAVFGVKEVPIDSGTISIAAGTDYTIQVSVSQNGALLLGKVGLGNFEAPRLCVGTNDDYSNGIPNGTAFSTLISSTIPLQEGTFFSNFIYAMDFYYNPPGEGESESEGEEEGGEGEGG